LTGWHHGVDVFAAGGTPLVAVADGRLFSVGWNAIGGWRLWLRDRQGNEFYYAHLSAFAPEVRNGAAVRAGQVIGYVGDTGDALGTPPHLHFEVHPADLVGLGYDLSAVDPYPYLTAWRRVQDVAFATPAAGHARAGGALSATVQTAFRYGRRAASAATDERAPGGTVPAPAPGRPPAPRREGPPPAMPAVERRLVVAAPDGTRWIDRRERLGAARSGGLAAAPAG
jgi:hypothetical protein